MSRHNYRRTGIRRWRYATAGRGSLGGGRFGALIGVVDHLTDSPHDGVRADDNHVYLWLAIADGPAQGRYECAINTESTSGSTAQYCLLEDETPGDELPEPGFLPVELSYAELGLNQAQFRPIVNDDLRALVGRLATACEIAVVYGVTYDNGKGMHDIHMNSGERTGRHPNRVRQDGAVAFYRRLDGGLIHRAWVLIKFNSQSLPRTH